MAPTTGPNNLEYLGIALFMLGGAWGLIKWVGRTIRGQLGSGMNRADEPFVPVRADPIPPALVKEAIARGLVTSAQLAGMTPVERQFLLAAMKDKLAAPAATPAPTAPTAPSAPNAPAAPSASPAPPAPPAPPRAINAAEFGMASMPADDVLHLHCPACGDDLGLPAFGPLVAHCARCGAKTIVRKDDGGRYVLNVTPRRPL